MLFNKKKSQNIYTARRSELNVKCKKQVNLLMIVDGETVIIPQSKINPDFYQNYTGKPSAHIAVA